MSLCLVAVFKNEDHILTEFINHYISQGVDKFLFINNDSNDDYLQKLQPFINNNCIELVSDNSKHVQCQYYSLYLEKCKLYDWVIRCDLDEFIYARNGFNSIKEYLNSLDDSVSNIHVPWKMFGSNGYIQQPESVIKSFTKRLNYNKDGDTEGIIIHNGLKFSCHKSITRTKYLISFDVHSNNTSVNNNITPDNVTVLENEPRDFSKIDEEILQNSFLHLNHYCIQSYDWFMRIKTTRGDAMSYNNVRDESYFKKYDSNCSDIDDYELNNLTYNITLM